MAGEGRARGKPGVLPDPGTEITILRKVESFSGLFTPGPAVITGAYLDHFGDSFVNLARDGRELATGVQWPIE
jgi:hypothetical protein